MKTKFKSVFLFLIINLIFIVTINGQVFGEIGTKWTYKATSDFNPNDADIIIQLESIGEEEINGINCKAIRITNKSCDAIIDDLNYIYQEDNKVFWYNPFLDDFTLLYDFNAQPGDTWSVQVEDCAIEIEIDSVKLEEFSGEMLKVLYPKPQNEFSKFRIIEKIGNENFVFLSKLSFDCWVICDGHTIKGGIRCYSDSTFNYSTVNDCDFVVSQEQIALDTKVAVYPTVTSSEFNVEIKGSNDLNFSNIKIYDFSGNTILVEKIPNLRKKKIALSNAGIYFVVIQLSNGRNYIRKVIVI